MKAIAPRAGEREIERAADDEAHEKEVYIEALPRYSSWQGRKGGMGWDGMGWDGMGWDGRWWGALLFCSLRYIRDSIVFSRDAVRAHVRTPITFLK